MTVTATRGTLAPVETTPAVSQATNREQFGILPLSTSGNALEGMAGILVQQSTYAQVSPFLRGLTGYQVLNLLDGLRFNNSSFRSGPNQYLAFVDPSQAFRIETVLGPTGAQYGSDAMGGVIHVLTPPAYYAQGAGREVHGEVRFGGASADRSMGGYGQVQLGTPRFAWLVGGSGRALGDLRGGGGADSRNALRRFFGLNDEQIRGVLGSRMPGTGFEQYGFNTKLNARPRPDHLLTLWFQRSSTHNVQGYKDLWGGLGRLQSDFDPQVLDFAYARYEKLRFAGLDTISGTFSVNEQRDGSERQNLLRTDSITRDDSTVRSLGYTVQAGKLWNARHSVQFGADYYDEFIDSFRQVTTPVNGRTVEQRALYPNGSKYGTFGAFGQGVFEPLPKLRIMLAGRLTRIGFRTFAERNRSTNGTPLGVTDSELSFRDFTYQTSASYNLTQRLGVHFLAGRGFRAPNLNDLGALGLNDLGFEIPASESVGAGALLGASSGENALSLGRAVTGLRAESLQNYEAGFTLRAGPVYSRVQAFHADLYDPIVRRTLLFPAGAAPTSLAGLAVAPIAPTAAQRQQGVVTVATANDPRAVKAFVNDGQTRYYGLEWLGRWTVNRYWTAESNYSFIVGRDLNPNRNVRRLPPQMGNVSLRYSRRWWMEVRAMAAGAQTRLSGGDIDDERIGASRRRSDIAAFFNGALVAPYVSGGRFTPTGETLAEIQNRVLPIGSTINGVRIADDASRAPMYLSTAGWVTLNVSAGMPIGERWSVGGGIQNLTDRNYRVHGSGMDSPGISVFGSLGFRW
ncbi:MAG: TonB-dependent receptor [Bryobacterales bacterium]|nr:TonB-dependent receptor [Bryobacterales bacterium]